MDQDNGYPHKPLQKSIPLASDETGGSSIKGQNDGSHSKVLAASIPSAAIRAVDAAAAAIFGSSESVSHAKPVMREREAAQSPALRTMDRSKDLPSASNTDAHHPVRRPEQQAVRGSEAFQYAYRRYPPGLPAHRGLGSVHANALGLRPQYPPLGSTLDLMFPQQASVPPSDAEVGRSIASRETYPAAHSSGDASHADAIQRHLLAHAQRTGDATLLQGAFGKKMEEMSGNSVGVAGTEGGADTLDAAARGGGGKAAEEVGTAESAGAGGGAEGDESMPEVMEAARAMWQASLRGERPDVEGFVGAVERQAASAGEAPLREHERAMLRAWADVSQEGALGLGAGDLGLPGVSTGLGGAALDSELGDPEGGGEAGEADWGAPPPARYRFADPESNDYMHAGAKAAAIAANAGGTAPGSGAVDPGDLAGLEDGARALGQEEAAAEGERLFGEGRPGPAVLALEAAVAQDPEDAASWLFLGRAHAEMEDDAQAIACLEAAVRADPHDLHALLALAVSYLNEKMDARALRCLKAWVECNPAMAAAGVHVDKGGAGAAGVEGRREAFGELLGLMRRVEAAAPEDPDVLGVLGVVFNLTREHDAAEAVLRRAVQGSPADHVLWNRLGATINNSGRPADAVSAYQEAVRLRPTFARGFFNLGIALFDSDQHLRAARAFTRALQLNPNAAHIWSHLRVALAVAEEFDLVDACGPEDVDALVKAMREHASGAAGGGEGPVPSSEGAAAAGGGNS